MRQQRVLAKAFGVEGAVVEDVEWKDDALHVVVRARARERGRCSRCGARGSGYDTSSAARRWRAPDVGLCRAYVVTTLRRVVCKEHGVVTEAVPWARPRSGFTRVFENLVAWLAVRTDKTTLSTLLRVAWRTVGAILERVVATTRHQRDPLEGVTRLGIDEVSYRKGHRYLTIVVDHDSGRLLFARPGRNEATLHEFFDQLGEERAAAVRLVSADAAPWIRNVVAERCPNAKLCLDPFHLVQMGTRALDDVRRSVWNGLRRAGDRRGAEALKGARWALWKNHDDLDDNQAATLARIEHTNKPLFRAYLLKEELRSIFQEADPNEAKRTFKAWLAWASRSRLPPFVKLARSLRTHRDAIHDVLEHRLSNARLEAAATKLRLLTRLAFGFHSHRPLVALALLRLGGLCPPLPARV